MRPTSYVGVTGFMCRQEVRLLLEMLPRPAGRLFMFGVLATDKTLRQEPNKRFNRYPPLARLDNIFVADPAVLNLIHYATGEPATLADQLERLTAAAGPLLNGFQLNMRDPDPGELRRFAAGLLGPGWQEQVCIPGEGAALFLFEREDAPASLTPPADRTGSRRSVLAAP